MYKRQAGNLVPDDQSSSRIVIYKSANQGSSWDYVSTVDTGGPFDYDPSPTSTTTTVWEPFLYMDAYGHLVCAYSDERQKANGVLQALSLRYTSDGTNWSELKNIVAVGNQNDRPGMVTVDQMPNGKYIATYEVVNKPSLSQMCIRDSHDAGPEYGPGSLLAQQNWDRFDFLFKGPESGYAHGHCRDGLEGIWLYLDASDGCGSEYFVLPV